LFDLNISMHVQSETDFPAVRQQIYSWKKRFPMFVHDVNQIEHIVEKHIQNFAIAGVYYRQTKSKSYLESAQKELDEINRVLSIAEKMELMTLLTRA